MNPGLDTFIKDNENEELINVSSWVSVVYNVLLILFSFCYLLRWEQRLIFLPSRFTLYRLLVLIGFLSLTLGSVVSVILTFLYHSSEDLSFERVSTIMNLMIMFGFFWLSFTCLKVKKIDSQAAAIISLYSIGIVYIILQMNAKF